MKERGKDRARARERARARQRARERAQPKLRDRFFQAGVARAITSPAGMLTGSLVGGSLVAGGAHPVWCVLGGLVGWGVPVVRAMQKVPGLGRPAPTQSKAEAPDEWERQVEDAEEAVDRFIAAVERGRSGPLLDRLRELEEDVLQSLGTVHELAQAGREAEAARRELNPTALTKAARRAGRAAEDAASSHRQLIAELLEVEDETRTRLTVVNGRLDEAVARATEILARSVADDDLQLRGTDASGAGGVAAEVAAELGRLSAALHEVDAHEHPHPPEVRAAVPGRSALAAGSSRKKRARPSTR